MVILLSGLALVQYVSNESARSYESCDEMAALSLAEAGAMYALEQLRQNPDFVGMGATQFGGGTFQASVTVPGGDATRRIVEATGTYNGAARSIRTYFERTPFRFPAGAMVSNSNIRITGSATTNTVPSTDHCANVHANGDVTITGSADIDGWVTAHGTVRITGSADCLGRQSGAPSVFFPDEPQVTAWENQWRTEAMTGTHYGSITISGSKTHVLTAPCYIAGTLKATGSATFIISGSGVVFVEGDINLTGSSKIRNSALLVAKGTIDITGSHGYVATGSPNSVAIVSLSPSSPAIKMTGSSQTELQGFIYAARGDVTLTGSDVVYGAVIAWGDITKTGSSDIYYPSSLNQSLDVLPGSFALSGWEEM
ncbi:MAG: DUF7305 domain-containing protein [Armatimonadota bacterium]